MPNLFGGQARIQGYVGWYYVHNFFDGIEERKANLPAIGTTVGQKPVVIPFTVANPVPLLVESQQRNQHYVHLIGRNGWQRSIDGFGNSPAIRRQLGVGRQYVVPQRVATRIGYRNGYLYVRPLLPDALNNKPRIDFVLVPNRQKRMNQPYIGKGLTKKQIGDLLTADPYVVSR